MTQRNLIRRNQRRNQQTLLTGLSVSTCMYIYCVLSGGDLNPFSSYDKSPWYEVSLEDFERYALDRLRVLAEIESSFARNRSWEELKSVTTRQSKDHLPLNSSSASTVDTQAERRNDHLGHFVLRLAFCRSCVTFSSSTYRRVTDF